MKYIETTEELVDFVTKSTKGIYANEAIIREGLSWPEHFPCLVQCMEEWDYDALTGYDLIIYCKEDEEDIRKLIQFNKDEIDFMMEENDEMKKLLGETEPF